jgi:hypothetical protein
MGSQGDFEYRRLGKILQRPDDYRICEGHLEREAVSGGMMASLDHVAAGMDGIIMDLLAVELMAA